MRLYTILVDKQVVYAATDESKFIQHMKKYAGVLNATFELPHD